MKLSIIIPVYNVESTLDQCVRSVLSQDIPDSEIILIDDGSTDQCPQMCDNYNTSFSCVRVIHQANQGLSAARNAGLDIAQGEYVTFVDSDDYLAGETYHRLIKELDEDPELDMIEYSFYERKGNLLRERIVQFTNTSYTNMRKYWLKGHAYEHTYAWNKIYRRHVFDQVRFPVGKTFEDTFTLPHVLANCRKVATSSHGLYYYKWNGAGITATAKGAELGDLLQAHREAFRNELFAIIDHAGTSLNSNKADDVGSYYAHLLNIQLDVYELTGQDPILPVLPYYNTWKLKLLHLTGMKRLCKLNSMIHKVTRHL